MIVRWISASVFFFALTAHAGELPKPTEEEVKNVAALIAKLGNEDFDVRQNAARDLRKFDARIRPLLQAALEQAGDVETANSLKNLIARFESRDKLKALAAKYEYNPEKLMIDGNAGLAKPTRETQTLLYLAAALFRRNATKEKDEKAREQSMMRLQTCERMAMIAIRTRRLPPDVDDAEV